MEHTFAALKDCFQSLQELWHPIQSEDDLQYMSYWVMCCIILHNMVIQFEENCGIFGGAGSTNDWALRNQGADRILPPEPHDPDVGLIGDTSYHGTPGHAARARLMEIILG